MFGFGGPDGVDSDGYGLARAGVVQVDNGQLYLQGGAGQDIIFRSNGTEFMRMKGVTGNFGIGTDDPQHALDVEGNISCNGNLFIDSAGTNALHQHQHI